MDANLFTRLLQLLAVILLSGWGFFHASAQQLDPAAAPAPRPMAVTAPGNYVLSPNDFLQIRVFQEDDLNSELRIAKDGTITFPLIGTIKVGGRTVNEAGQLIQELLQKDYLVRPQVTVNILEYSKRRFAVLGQVTKAGYYLIPNEETVNLLQAIAMAGGYTRIADPSRITVKRVTPQGQQVIKLNAKAMARDNSAEDFLVLPDDTITVGESLF